MMCMLDRHRCDLSNRSKMIVMIRNMSVDKLCRLEMCGVILVITPRGDIKCPPQKHNNHAPHQGFLEEFKI